MKNKLLFLFLYLLLIASSHATQQIKDKLVYKDKINDLIECGGSHYSGFFLEQYFLSGHPKPKEPLGYGSTGCYRGYIATWELKDNKLYLAKLETESWPDEASDEIPLTKVFPEATNHVFSFWVTAQIRIPQGKELPFHHDGSGSDHERDLYVNLTNGVVKTQHEVENIGKTALLSIKHMKWILSAEKPVKNDKLHLWDDARDVATDAFYEDEIDHKYPFRTRGFISNIENREGCLDVSETRLTPDIYFNLHDIPADFSATNGTPVEIAAKFIPDEYDHEDLKVESIRLLQPGEAIHHPYFKLPMHQIGL